MKKKISKKLVLSKETLWDSGIPTPRGVDGGGPKPDYTAPSLGPTCTTCWSLDCYPTRAC
jgi:hypothetical protein